MTDGLVMLRWRLLGRRSSWAARSLGARPAWMFTVPATLARTGQRPLLHLADHHPWAEVVHDADARLRAWTAGPVPAPG